MITHDTLQGSFPKVPRDIKKLAKDVAAICPDYLDDMSVDDIAEGLRDGRLLLWWD